MRDHCTLTDEELIEKVKEWAQELTRTAGRSWCLRIPPDHNHDPELLMHEVCDRLEKANELLAVKNNDFSI